LHNLPFELVSFPFGDLAMWVAVFFTVISGWDYFAKNWEALKNSN
ncbi:MAG: CDP-diacylglycerol--glycerol-3-phosphate 3-phosphatidyltransferase, partial [Bacillus sp. (in: Bacteria)]|nr:CDP-diacylglycerol--glycerol-3-phosphate 3-phosphatidyltransferase [Bacillus sp. (in: firmicutes)]